MSFRVAVAFKAFAVVFEPPNSRLFGYLKNCVSRKYLWALPTPTTFEKVDQTFIMIWQNSLLNHNLTSTFRIKFK